MEKVKWKGAMNPPKEERRILFEKDDRLQIGIYRNGCVNAIAFTYSFHSVDEWMYEEEAQRILFEHSWPNLNFDL